MRLLSETKFSAYLDNETDTFCMSERAQEFSVSVLLQEADKYINVNVSDLNVQKENEDIRVKFKLCLVHSDEERYLVDELKKLLGKLNNNTITGLTFEASGE